jgi:hypothetical protein
LAFNVQVVVPGDCRGEVHVEPGGVDENPPKETPAGNVNVVVGFKAASGPLLTAPNVTATVPGTSGKCAGADRVAWMSAPRFTAVTTGVDLGTDEAPASSLT